MANERSLKLLWLRIFAVLYGISLIVCSVGEAEAKSKEQTKLLAVTVATNETDGFRRYLRSAKKYKYDVKVVGMHQKWKGGEIQSKPGGGQKINLLRGALEEYKDQKDLVIMFTDSYDVIFSSGPDMILSKFKALGKNLVFSAEPFLWPDRSLRSHYPEVKNGYKFLCSGMYIGYASYIWRALTWRDIADDGDDQLYFSHLYLDENKREKWKMALDNGAVLFQNMNGAQGDIVMRHTNNNTEIVNTKYDTFPVVLHGNGLSKTLQNNFGNYLAGHWNPDEGCTSCEEDTFSLENVMEDDFPRVLLALFVEVETPFIDDFFEQVQQLDYPKKKIDLFVHNSMRHHQEKVDSFFEGIKPDYRSAVHYSPDNNLTEAQGRNKGMQHCDNLQCDYYFSWDSDVRLTELRTLQFLIEQNRSIIAPMIRKEAKLWSNFWGDVNREGFYLRSEDYIDIVKKYKIGVWNVAFIGNVYLVHGSKIHAPHTPTFEMEDTDPDMAFCEHLRNKGVFMYVTNRETFGYLVATEYYEPDHFHSDLWELWSNRKDWERRYIHPDYYEVVKKDTPVQQACPDVYTFALFTETYTRHLIEEMEHFGQWSGGTNKDARVSGGYENVPTRDIHMRQIDYEKHFLYFLREYIKPICEKVYPGYDSRAHAIMNFVVRYRPDEQPALRPHHDSSTYTINVALNKKGEDYEGGGARFIRYNCSVIGLAPGHLLMHPGRLTHYHEGLPTTNGTRYILVSFIDP